MPIVPPRRRQEIRPIAAINLTSLLDVTFVLLLTFMIVAPTLKTGIEIDLPDVETADPLTMQKTATITLRKPATSDGEAAIYLDNRRVDMKELETGLKELHARLGAKLDIVIEPDRAVTVEPLLRVMGLVDEVGIANMGVLTERTERR